MKKEPLMVALLMTLAVAVFLSGVAFADGTSNAKKNKNGGNKVLETGVAAISAGVRFDFQIEPGCVVGITPLDYWYKDANGVVHKGRGAYAFNLGRVSWTDNPPFRTLNGVASYDIDLWCPGIAPTYQGTIHVEHNADGQQNIWFPLHEAELGVFYKGWWVTIDAEEPE